MFFDWADAHWRPVLDRIKTSDPNIIATVCDDRNGFLPTHLSDRSRKPTGKYEHDLQYCRNGRIIFNAIDKRIKASDAPFSMAVYRYEGDGRQYRVVRLASVPIVINGRRWATTDLLRALTRSFAGSLRVVRQRGIERRPARRARGQMIAVGATLGSSSGRPHAHRQAGDRPSAVHIPRIGGKPALDVLAAVAEAATCHLALEQPIPPQST